MFLDAAVELEPGQNLESRVSGNTALMSCDRDECCEKVEKGKEDQCTCASFQARAFKT